MMLEVNVSAQPSPGFEWISISLGDKETIKDKIAVFSTENLTAFLQGI